MAKHAFSRSHEVVDPAATASSEAVEPPRTPSPPPRAGRTSPKVAPLLAALLDLVVLACVLGHVVGHAREVLGLAACLVVPGYAIVGLLRLRDPVLELSLTLAVGLASLVLVAQLALTAHVWHLFAIVVAILLVSLPSLGFQALGARRRR